MTEAPKCEHVWSDEDWRFYAGIDRCYRLCTSCGSARQEGTYAYRNPPDGITVLEPVITSIGEITEYE